MYRSFMNFVDMKDGLTKMSDLCEELYEQEN